MSFIRGFNHWEVEEESEVLDRLEVQGVDTTRDDLVHWKTD